jgi:putative flippase GtrA
MTRRVAASGGSMVYLGRRYYTCPRGFPPSAVSLPSVACGFASVAVTQHRTAGYNVIMQMPYRLLPASLQRLATPTRQLVVAQFLRFGVVGAVGFVVDTATVYSLRHILGLYGAGVVAYVAGASGNWVLNRIWTFRGRSGGPAHRQWVMFMIANLAGFVLNRGAYALLVTFVAAAADQPVIATAAGAIAGMFVNFSLSRRLVFR